MPRGTCNLPWGIFNLRRGIFNLPRGIAVFEQGRFDLERGRLDVDQGIGDLHQGILESFFLRHHGDAEVRGMPRRMPNAVRLRPKSSGFAAKMLGTKRCGLRS